MEASYPASRVDRPDHLFYSCVTALDCWGRVSVPVFVEDSSFLDWVEQWFQNLNGEEVSLVAMICWQLWVNRNDLAAWKVAHVKNAQLKMTRTVHGDGQDKWSPPVKGWLKANIDAAVFSGNGGVGVGIVVRDWKGSLVQVRQV
ncbi:uncharacterized protein LOC126657129 [Mercurialis annua]|uniref:uncharacterized protein LOC126657129 n=1 Tax=Mercurialis annua TaxID=3986 RepID=UPI0021600FE2|nr:uncharacterized protein LOC126657129 [Mercurialis annua]